ncbi:uclacyanin-3-like [Magnolia sinica]|uniref:uclacyanin-3-like n=1 Tax=Magnolia sinica TaxID=86752 RepID=UPI002658F4CC|nr:uclacyanin-3-like [Magnolia sinica]
MARIGIRLAFSIVVTVVALSAFATATEYIVGDDSGWTLGFDYATWAEGKKFRVGDTLVFNYTEGDHTVVKVNGTGFASCSKSPNSGVLASGSDRVTLTTTGNKWYICGVGSHCDNGQKLKITVLPKMMLGSPAPAPDTSFPWGPLLPNTPVMPPTVETPGSGWASEGSHDPKWEVEAPAPAPASYISFTWGPLLPTTPVMPPTVETPGSGWASEESHGSKWAPPAPSPDTSFPWEPLIPTTPVMPPMVETPASGWTSEGSHGPKWTVPAPAPDTSFPWEPLIPTTPVMPPMVETPGYGWASEEPKWAEMAPAPTPWVPSMPPSPGIWSVPEAPPPLPLWIPSEPVTSPQPVE